MGYMIVFHKTYRNQIPWPVFLFFTLMIIEQCKKKKGHMLHFSLGVESEQVVKLTNFLLQRWR